MRAGGAGIPGFYTKTGVGTLIAEGKEVKSFDGEEYILERGIRADLAIIKGWKADTKPATSSSARPRATSTRRPRRAEQALRRRGRGDRAGRVASIPTRSICPGIYVNRLILARALRQADRVPNRAPEGGRLMPWTRDRDGGTRRP